MPGGGGYLHILIRGCAIRKGIDFHDFGIRNGTISIFAIFAIGLGSGMHFRKTDIKSGIYF